MMGSTKAGNFLEESEVSDLMAAIPVAGSMVQEVALLPVSFPSFLPTCCRLTPSLYGGRLGFFWPRCQDSHSRGLGRQLHNAPLEVAMMWGASFLMAAVFIVSFVLFLVTSAWIFWLVRKSTRSNVAR